ncbi:MAG: hypothetical protein ACI88H_002468 [Cocleimonas sp.]|jgi:hypothetical protein
MALSLAEITETIGVLGFVFYMLSYFLLLIGKIAGTDNSYILMNFIAASCVLVGLIHNFNLASALIQIFWIVISVVGLVRYNSLLKSTSKPMLHVDTV